MSVITFKNIKIAKIDMAKIILANIYEFIVKANMLFPNILIGIFCKGNN